MQTGSFRGLGEPAWVNAYSNACEGLGPYPRTALGPAAIRAASTGRTRDRTRPMLHERQNVLARAPSTRDPKRAYSAYIGGGLIASFSRKTVERSFFRARMRSSSEPASLLYPTTSDTRIAASFRVSTTALLPRGS